VNIESFESPTDADVARMMTAARTLLNLGIPDEGLDRKGQKNFRDRIRDPIPEVRHGLQSRISSGRAHHIHPASFS
jgi:hypothetical protein